MSIIKKIIRSYFQGEYDQKTIRDFSSWLLDSDNEDVKDETLHEIWDEMKINSDDSTSTSFYKFRENNMIDQKPKINKSIYLRFIKIASIILLPVLSASITFYYVKNTNVSIETSNVEMVEYFASNGEMKDFILPDSSTVKLNAGSLLILPKEFSSHERAVYLAGEAFFDITHNGKKPFKVKTTDIDIEVLGTTFNVSSYKDNRLATTTLSKGKVRVYVKESQEEYVLKPGEQVQYDRQEHISTLNITATDDALAWIKGDLVVSKATIKELANIIERKYGVNVYLSSTKFKNEKITMNLVNDEDLSQCMSILSQIVRNLQYKIEEDNVFIY